MGFRKFLIISISGVENRRTSFKIVWEFENYREFSFRSSQASKIFRNRMYENFRNSLKIVWELENSRKSFVSGLENRRNSLKIVWEFDDYREVSFRGSNIVKFIENRTGIQDFLKIFGSGLRHFRKSSKFVENRRGFDELSRILVSEFEYRRKSS